MSKSSDQYNQMMGAMSPITKVYLAATGNKLINVAFDKIDANIELRTWCRFWDNCAPEAIIKSLGCHMIFLDPWLKEQKMQRVVYLKEAHPEKRVLPFVIARNYRILKIVRTRLTK